MKLESRPVSLVVGLLLVLVWVFTLQGLNLDEICGKGFAKALARNFVHLNLFHLLVNLYALEALSRIELYLGSGSYLILLFIILLLASTMEFLLNETMPSLRCSIGFSGVLFGLLAWELMVMGQFQPYLFLVLLVMVVFPTLQNPQASLIGHGLGALAGVLTALVWRK